MRISHGDFGGEIFDIGQIDVHIVPEHFNSFGALIASRIVNHRDTQFMLYFIESFNYIGDVVGRRNKG